MALDTETAQELIRKLAEDRAAYLDTIDRTHDLLAQALTAVSGGKPPPKLTAETVRRTENVRRDTNGTGDIESVLKDSTFSGEDETDSEDDESLFVQQELPEERYDEEGLKKHIQEHQWTEFSRAIVSDILDDQKLLRKKSMFPQLPDPVPDRSHLTHYSIFNVGNDGAPMEIQHADPRQTSRAGDIWRKIRSINTEPSRKRAVGRITIVREPSPLLFAALHFTHNKHFDVDGLFKLLVEEKTRAFAHQAFNPDHRHQSTFVFTFEYFTIIGEECKPMTWQKFDKNLKESDLHIPVSRCCSVVALSLGGEAISKVRKKDRRRKREIGSVYDPFAPWRVLNIQAYPDWKSSLDSHDSTKHYVNGPEAFLITLRAEFKDAQKRLWEVYNRISQLVRPPPQFMFDPGLRDKLLFEDDDFTYSRRYFWAQQSLAIMNEDIQEMVTAYRRVFTEDVWNGSNKIIWPGDESLSSRFTNFRKRMGGLRKDIDLEIERLEEINEKNEEKMKEIKVLRENLFSGTSVFESRKAVEQATITVQQGHNIKLLTLVTIFFLPLTFVTSVFGMTNMPPNGGFKPFGIVTAITCVPTYMLIGSLNTTSGLQFWTKKTRVFFSSCGRSLAKTLALVGWKPKWTLVYHQSKMQPNTASFDPGKGPRLRSQSASEGMAARSELGSIPLSSSTQPLTRGSTIERRPPSLKAASSTVTFGPAVAGETDRQSTEGKRDTANGNPGKVEATMPPERPSASQAEKPKWYTKYLPWGSKGRTTEDDRELC